MITSEELVEQTQDAPQKDCFKIGTVSALFPTVATAKIIFDGETIASEKQYSYLSSYAPTVNDRVLLAQVSGTYVVMGKISYNVVSATNQRAAVVTYTFNTATSCYVGFFGVNPVAKQTVADPTAITAAAAPSAYSQTWGGQVKTDLGNIYTKLKAITDAMQAYGLF